MDQQGSQIPIASLADATQAHLAAAGVLIGHQPQPGGELAPRLELTGITYRRHHGRGADRANTLDLQPCRAGETRAVCGVCRLPIR